MQGLINKVPLDDIGAAIRQKLGNDTTYLPSEMAEAIRQIQGDELALLALTFQSDYSTKAKVKDKEVLQVCHSTFDENNEKIISVEKNDKIYNVEYDNNGIITKIGEIPIDGILNLIMKVKDKIIKENYIILNQIKTDIYLDLGISVVKKE